MTLEKKSPCKVNLLLNILGKRPDGFHELETVMHPVRIYDELTFSRTGSTVQLSCNHPQLPVDSGNLVHRAATAFLAKAGIRDGVRIHLEKRQPLAAGLGGGSGNAATTLTGLNELFGKPLSDQELESIAASLGSDIPFFLQSRPALATGRGERIEALDPFPAMNGAAFLLVHPGFGISTAWAYQTLAQYPAALNGQPGRARKLIQLLNGSDLKLAGRECYNSLEAPALHKHPILTMYQEFFREHGAAIALMSGSGSTSFAVVQGLPEAELLAEKFKVRFGEAGWIQTVAA